LKPRSARGAAFLLREVIFLRMVEESESPDRLPGWQQPEFKIGQSIYKTRDRFLALPSW